MTEQTLDAHGATNVKAWFQLLHDLRHCCSDEQIVWMTDAFWSERLRYVRDQDGDCWHTPIEALTQGIGDCEEFALGKYYTLRRVGFGDDRCRLGQCYIRKGRVIQSNVTHAVCLVYLDDGSPFVLDNLPGFGIVRLSVRPDLLLIYELGATGMWVKGERSPLGKHPRMEQIAAEMEARWLT